MSINLEEYLPYVDDLDLTLAEKMELLHLLSQIMKSFVDCAFGFDPTQLCLGEQAQDRSLTDLAHDIFGSDYMTIPSITDHPAERRDAP